MIIVDSHQDLAWNIKTFGRDYSRSAHETRQIEALSDTPSHNGHTLLGWPEYQKGRVALVFGTMFASPIKSRLGPWDTQTYRDINQARAFYKNQMEQYYRICDRHSDKFHLVKNLSDLETVLSQWEDINDPLPSALEDRGSAEYSRHENGGRRKEEINEKTGGKEEDESSDDQRESNGREAGEEAIFRGRKRQVGIVPLMEGADGIRHVEELEEWWDSGLRIIGLAWTGTRYSGGTRQPGPLTPEGFELLEAMGEIGYALDISHMDEQAVLQALDSFSGIILASHSNAAVLLKGLETNRHLSDPVIRGLIERDAVIGVIPYNRFLLPGWTIKDGRDKVSLLHLVAHIDHICQLAGDAQHVGIGSDFDGGFGLRSVPHEIDTIADLRKLIPLLLERGYAENDIKAIMGQNWIDRLKKILPEGN
jgi:membrane dipeptidase